MIQTPEELVLFAFLAITSACFVIVLIYVSVRAAGVAWYKSKYEHFRRVMKQLGKNGDIL